MKLTTVLLCDFAQVREGLLFVSSGGITQMTRAEYPAPMLAHLAMVVELHPTEAGRPREVEILVQSEDGRRVAKAAVTLQVDVPEAAPADARTTPVAVPLVAPLTNVELPGPGRYSIEILLDGVYQHTLTLRAVAPDPTGGPTGM